MDRRRVLLIFVLILVILNSCITSSLNYIRTADGLRMSQKWSEAAEFYTKAIETGEEARIAYYWRAECYYRMGETDKAIADCKQFLLLTKDQPYKNRYLRERNKTIFNYRKWNLDKGIMISKEELAELGEMVINDQTAGIGSQSAAQGSTGGMSDD